MSMKLYYTPRSRAFTALWLLEELGQPYELESFALDGDRHKQPDYLALNPMGKVPLVVVSHEDGEVPVSETGAIAMYLAERFPESKLAPAVSDAKRAAYLRWMLFSGSVIEPALGEKFFQWEVPARSVSWGCFADMERTLSDALSASPYLLGEEFSAADIVVGASARFGLLFGAFEKTGPIADYVARLVERPAFKRADAIETREGERFPPAGR